MIRFSFILCISVLYSCSFIDPLNNKGKNIETVIEVDNFTRIEPHNIFNIEIVEDSESYILYKGGDNILDKMTYSSLSGILKLDHSFINWSKNFKIPTLEIHMPLLEGIDLYASGTIKSLNQLTGDNLIVNIHESSNTYEIDLNINYNHMKFHSRGSVGGTFAVEGICPTSAYTLNGSTNIQASNLVSKEVSIGHNSLGNAHIYVEDELTVTFYKSGNVYYKGNPENINVKYIQINNQRASGKLIQKRD